jgi:hypothetical protein
VLLYVSRHEGRLIHQKYQFDAVYETRDGGWAGCGDPYRNAIPEQRGDVRPGAVAFADPPSFPVAGFAEDEIAKRFPPHLFERRGDRVVCTGGATIEELFQVQREGVLGARGLFGAEERGER